MEGREITEVIQSALNRAELTNLTVDFIGTASRNDFLGIWTRFSGHEEVISLVTLWNAEKSE